jgi:predicted ATPase/class 3 adenylate cyclase/DNA-binding CsgD family transcriptional regulator
MSDVQDHRSERVGRQRVGRRSPRMYAYALTFCRVERGMLASMSGIDSLNWRDVGVIELLPTGTVTLLLADVEGSTRLWQTQAEMMTSAVANLDRTLSEVVTAHHGVRPIEQGEGDSFVVAFTRASDAVACALALQRAPLSPIRLRIGLHTGEVQLRDEGNYIGSTINRTGRLRDMAHGGQTLLSGTASDLAMDQLPSDAWLTDLGSHVVRDLPRPEHVMQLCHSDVLNEFPPLRTSEGLAAQQLPVQLTSFIGREAQMADVRGLIGADRLVTLTGAGGIGKTRLAVQVATQMAAEFGDGVRYVDLAPITDAALVPITAARALGLPDQPGRSTMDSLLRFIGDRQLLMVLDNCEHLLDATAALTTTLLGACPGLAVLATSRELIGVPGEVTWRVPSMSLADEAIALFTDRARHARPDFSITDDNAATVREICHRLDGMPLALELAAARVRALSPAEILDGLHDRFRLLTGGSRTAVRRQQTLRASVDWSHALLTEPERALFRRLAVCMGGFDLDAAQAIAGDEELHRHQVLDVLTLLIDKSLIVAENISGRTRYRLMETVRQYALEKLSESGEADEVRDRHRDHYTATAALFDGSTSSEHQLRLERTEAEMDNLRAAFAWSREHADTADALGLASALQPLWLSGGRILEGLSWFYAILTDDDEPPTGVRPDVYVRAIADKAILTSVVGVPDRMERVEQSLRIARDLGDPGLLLRALTACGSTAVFNPDVARPYLAEALQLARASGDTWRLSQALWWLAFTSAVAGDLPVALQAGTEGYQLAQQIGDHFVSRMCRFWGIGTAQMMQGQLAAASGTFRELVDEAEAANDPLAQVAALSHLAHTLAYMGDIDGARSAATTAAELGAEFGGFFEGLGYAPLARAALAAGDVAAAAEASEAARQRLGAHPVPAGNTNPVAEIALASGDLSVARRCADEAVSLASGVHLAVALIARTRVAMARGEFEDAERDAHKALVRAGAVESHATTPDALECLATIACASGSHRGAARLLGAAHTLRERTGIVRFKVNDAEYDVCVNAMRTALGDSDFDSAWAEGSVLSAEEAIAYAQRGRGERKRPSSGWASLTPTERDVVELVSEGLGNKEIATRLFVSPRTVQTHLTHVYAKLGLTSRVQLVHEAARHA